MYTLTQTGIFVLAAAAASAAALSAAMVPAPTENQVPIGGGPQGAVPAVQRVRDALKNAEVIPTVIADFEPSFLLKVTWSAEDHAALGNTLAVEDVGDQPDILLREASSSSSSSSSSAGLRSSGDMTYTVAITDPDAPSRDDPKWSEFCHFIATGVTFGRSTTLRDVVSYKPPGPPPKTGKHRYVFLVFAPANGTTEHLNLTAPSGRKHWGTGKERHGKHNEGSASAGNMDKKPLTGCSRMLYWMLMVFFKVYGKSRNFKNVIIGVGREYGNVHVYVQYHRIVSSASSNAAD
ncbi:phosphatidylethanolamine-binding protein [Xylariaceae sp. FL0804]|nr:phosphatidylethanolamine-binding protein [Xylariaceae sp. FL0804]